MRSSGHPKLSKAMGNFWRNISSRNSRLVESTCSKCRSFVAASAKPELLEFVERMHRCTDLRTSAPLPTIS